MNQTRNFKMDYYKGILMLGVVLGHLITTFKATCTVDVYIHTFIRTYDMPFFMLISGLFLAKSVDKYVAYKNIINKITSIMVPIITWGSIFSICKYVLSMLLGNQISFGRYIVGIFTGSWFLWSALVCSCLMILICAIFKNMHTRLVVSILVSLFFLIVPNDIYNIAFMFPFYSVGFFAEWGLSKISSRKLSVLKFLAVALFVVLLCFWDAKYNVWNAGSYLLGGSFVETAFAVIFRFSIGLTGCITMMFVFDVLLNIDNPIMKYVNKELISVGTNTMAIYLIQGFVVEYLLMKIISIGVEIIGFNPFVFNGMFLGCVIAPVIAFLFLVITNRVIIFMKKSSFINKMFFGFKAVNAKK